MEGWESGGGGDGGRGGMRRCFVCYGLAEAAGNPVKQCCWASSGEGVAAEAGVAAAGSSVTGGGLAAAARRLKSAVASGQGEEAAISTVTATVAGDSIDGKRPAGETKRGENAAGWIERIQQRERAMTTMT